jgi:protein-tyrosine phosphatase
MIGKWLTWVLGLFMIASSAGAQEPHGAHRILFVCTGNYYRSRYAEAVFNHLAYAKKLPWVAISRGLDTSKPHDPFNLSPIVVKDLQSKNIPFDPRNPIALTESDLQSLNLGDQVVALDEKEHRPMVQKKFPKWEGRFTYFHVVDKIAPETLPSIYTQVSEIVDHLK